MADLDHAMDRLSLRGGGGRVQRGGGGGRVMGGWSDNRGGGRGSHNGMGRGDNGGRGNRGGGGWWRGGSDQPSLSEDDLRHRLNQGPSEDLRVKLNTANVNREVAGSKGCFARRVAYSSTTGIDLQFVLATYFF